MNSKLIIIFLIITFDFSLASKKDFVLNQSGSIKSVVMCKIVRNLLNNYITVDELSHITVVISPLKSGKNYFQEDFVSNLLHLTEMPIFDYTIRNKLFTINPFKQRNILKLILIDDSKSLRYVLL